MQKRLENNMEKPCWGKRRNNRYFHYTVTKVSNGGFSVALTYSKIHFVLPKVGYITKGNLKKKTKLMVIFKLVYFKQVKVG